MCFCADVQGRCRAVAVVGGIGQPATEFFWGQPGMRRQSMKTIVALAILTLFTGCVTVTTQTADPLPASPSQNSEAMERALIIGSEEVPDPVLTRVRELEKSGVVKDVVVLESFPAQIHLTAPKRVIDELNKIPRVGGIR
jgi:hypothetical protein